MSPISKRFHVNKVVAFVVVVVVGQTFQTVEIDQMLFKSSNAFLSLNGNSCPVSLDLFVFCFTSRLSGRLTLSQLVTRK